MSFGGGPSAFTSSLIGWASAMSTCGLAPSWVQPRRPTTASPSSGSGGTWYSSSTFSMNCLCCSGIIPASWSAMFSGSRLPAPAYDAGITTSTPYGLPSTCSSIQLSSISNWSVENASAPSTPMPPARLTAATTSRQWLKAKIGRSMPNMSQTRVRTFLSSGVASGDLGGPAIVGLSARRAHDAVDDVELPGNLVTSNLRTAVLLDVLQRWGVVLGGSQLDDGRHPLAPPFVGD